MFGVFNDLINSSLNVADDLLHFEAPSREDVVRLADAGLTIAAISAATGFAASTVVAILEDS